MLKEKIGCLICCGYKSWINAERISYEDKLKKLDLFSMETKRLQGDLNAAFQYLKRAGWKSIFYTGRQRKDREEWF